MLVLKIIAFIPALIGVLVGRAEIRSDERLSDKVRRLVPAALAVALVAFFSYSLG